MNTNTKHGFNSRANRHPIYDVWANMLRRCENPNHPSYSYYGGRGITVCRRWKAFPNFLKDMLPTYRRGLYIERIDNEKGYSKSNCKWTSPAAQMRNTRRTKLITFNGKTLCLTDWAVLLNIVPSALRTRIDLHGVKSAMTKTKFTHAY